jgi:hypothetical protein
VFLTFQHLTAASSHPGLPGCNKTKCDLGNMTSGRSLLDNCSCGSPVGSSLKKPAFGYSSKTAFKGYFYVEAISEPEFTPWGQMNQPAAAAGWTFPVTFKPLSYYINTDATSATPGWEPHLYGNQFGPGTVSSTSIGSASSTPSSGRRMKAHTSKQLQRSPSSISHNLSTACSS